VAQGLTLSGSCAGEVTAAIDDLIQLGPPADVHLFGLPPTIELERLWEIHRAAGAPCVFVRDSGQESALALA
jgi:hypothetical protein